jgi:hypothetical protein
LSRKWFLFLGLCLNKSPSSIIDKLSSIDWSSSAYPEALPLQRQLSGQRLVLVFGIALSHPETLLLHRQCFFRHWSSSSACSQVILRLFHYIDNTSSIDWSSSFVLQGISTVVDRLVFVPL